MFAMRTMELKHNKNVAKLAQEQELVASLQQELAQLQTNSDTASLQQEILRLENALVKFHEEILPARLKSERKSDQDRIEQLRQHGTNLENQHKHQVSATVEVQSNLDQHKSKAKAQIAQLQQDLLTCVDCYTVRVTELEKEREERQLEKDADDLSRIELQMELEVPFTGSVEVFASSFECDCRICMLLCWYL